MFALVDWMPLGRGIWWVRLSMSCQMCCMPCVWCYSYFLKVMWHFSLVISISITVFLVICLPYILVCYYNTHYIWFHNILLCPLHHIICLLILGMCVLGLWLCVKSLMSLGCLQCLGYTCKLTLVWIHLEDLFLKVWFLVANYSLVFLVGKNVR